MKGKEYGVGDFPHEIIQISIPQIRERKEDEKCEKMQLLFRPLNHVTFSSFPTISPQSNTNYI